MGPAKPTQTPGIKAWFNSRRDKIDPRFFPKILNSPPFPRKSDVLHLQPRVLSSHPVPSPEPPLSSSTSPTLRTLSKISSTSPDTPDFSCHPRTPPKKGRYPENHQEFGSWVLPGNRDPSLLHLCPRPPSEQPRALKIQSVPAPRTTPSPSLSISHQAWTVTVAEFPSCPW